MNFFIMKKPAPGETDADSEYLPCVKPNYGPADKCSLCGVYTSLLSWLPPYNVEIKYWAKKHGDVAYFMDTLLVSERFKDLFFENKLTGLILLGKAEVKRVIPKKMKTGMPNYYAMKVSRGGAVFDQRLSHAEHEGKVCSACGLSDDLIKFKMVCLKRNTWKRLDIFQAIGLPGEIITTEKYKEFCTVNNISNVILIPAKEYSYDSSL